MILRTYQSDLIDRVRAAYRAGARSVVMQLVTGAGKTAVAAELIRRSLATGRRVVFVAHLDALLDDTLERLRAASVPCGLVQADRPADSGAPVQVCSTQTLAVRGTRPPADFVILDEAHRACSRTVREILAAYPRAHILLLTATPQRGDGQALGDVAQALVCGPSLAELTRQGYLVPARVLAPEQAPDGALGMDPVEAWQRWCAPLDGRQGRPTVIFAVHQEHAHEIAARIPGALVVIAETDRQARHSARVALSAGIAPAVVTVRALCEGWDCPEVSAVILCAACTTVTSYLQPIGRGLRTALGKRDCLVIDLRGASLLHGLPADPREWTLEGSGVRAQAEGPNLRRCKTCWAIFPAATRCPLCGSLSLQDPRPVRIQRAEFFERSGISITERLRHYRESIQRRLLAAGKPAWLAERIASRANPPWARESRDS